MAEVEYIEIPYRPRALQAEIHEHLKRFSVLVCHRRFGKTVLTVNELLKGALTCERERPRFAYIAPLFRQAKQAAWDYLLHYTQPIPDRQAFHSELRVDLPNGGRVQLFGADNPDALRGMYLDGVVLDEYAQMPPRLWDEVIRPLLADRKGWAIFIGTPAGHNLFWELWDQHKDDEDWYVKTFRASQTDIVDPEELEGARKQMSVDKYAQEFECSWSAAISGAYYGTQMEAAADRIGEVPYDPAVVVETWWDLGIGDSTSIWFAQRVGKEIHLIDHYEESGEPLAHYVRVLQERKYVYGQHHFPHDVQARELIAGKTREEVLRSLGVKPTVCKMHRVEDGIEGARNLISRCWFDADKCKYGIEALRQYRKEWNDKRRVYRDTPLHDWTSHAADAFRIGAMSQQADRHWFDRPIEYSDVGIV